MPPKRAPPPRRGAAATPKQEPNADSPAEQSTAGAAAESSIEINSNQATPAGTPAPNIPALQRADSASRPPSGSPSARGTSSARGVTSGRGRTVAKPKFAGRRSQKSRAELEKEEGERRKEEAERKAKEDLRNRRRIDARNRGAFRGRQRGGYMGEGERKKDVPVMSGPFSLGQAVADSSKRHAPSWAARSGLGGGSGGGGGGSSGSGGGSGGGGYGSYSGGGGGQSGVKSEYGGGDSGAFIKAEDGGYISSDDDEEDKAAGGRRNIDDLAYIDLTGDDDAPNAVRSSFAPVRIQRVEHKERTIGINTEGLKDAEEAETGGKSRSISPTLKRKDKGKQKARDVEITGEQHRYQGVYSESSSEQEGEPRIKVEQADDEPNRVSTPEPPAHDAANVPEVPMQSPGSSPEARRKSKARVKSQTVAKPTFQTHEEETEWDLHQKDLRILRDELGTLAIAPQPTDKDGDAAMSGTDAQPQQPQEDPRADKVYLFQFPPILPSLAPVTVKPDPDAPEAPADSNADQPISVSEATPAPSSSKPPAAPISGLVGKLRIHASGRATLDWGGTAMEVGMGTEASFLQDVIIAEFSRQAQEVDSKEGVKEGKEPEITGGTAMAMGQVKGKFVVTPDWEEILR